MNLYRISQQINNDYDTYDSAVVCAENEEEARRTHPSSFVTHYKNGKWYGTRNDGIEYETGNDLYSDWVMLDQIDKIEVKYLGSAGSEIEKGVICASFNAG
jgi:hypothetical protein